MVLGRTQRHASLSRGLVLTCEHASPNIPRAYAPLFAATSAQKALRSHRGFDPGALAVARQLAEQLHAPLYATRVSRLLVEVNRSIGHPSLFSSFTAALSQTDKRRLVERYYRPHRQRVEAALTAQLARHKTVLHVAIHSFTPVLDKEVRRADLGLLYDPRRRRELRLAERLQTSLSALLPALRIRRNYPYHGASDGLTTALRRAYGPRYLGFEVEINQALIASSRLMRERIARALCDAITDIM